MQHLAKMIQAAKRRGVLSEPQLLNQVREYVQVVVLKAIYQSAYGRGLSFGGGTCLRICYDLKRYSEDLDFSLDGNSAGYSFRELNAHIAHDLEKRGFDAHMHVRDDKIVQKSFIRLADIVQRIGSTFRKKQKLHIKLEVDSRPIPVTARERETFFVTKYAENFPIIKHTDDTLFAGKILAVLNRAYTKGRDYYDLIWYLSRKSKINLPYVNNGMQQQAGGRIFHDEETLLQALEEKVRTVSVKKILQDLDVFLEDPMDKRWIQDFPRHGTQLLAQYRG